MMSIIQVENLKKIYNPYSVFPKTALHDLSLNVKKNEFVCIMGTSGSGKTTLINILATIDDATNGKVFINGRDIAIMSEKQKALIRKSEIGFIFQNYNLIESLRIKDNILFSLRINKVDRKTQLTRLHFLSKQLDIEEILEKYPSQCSGGQQQRAAIARALIMQPSIIFADEPTGNLDSLNAKELMELFRNINRENETTIVMVTHDSLVASYSSKVFYLEDGKISKTIEKNDRTQEEYYRDIINITTKMDLSHV